MTGIVQVLRIEHEQMCTICSSTVLLTLSCQFVRQVLGWTPNLKSLRLVNNGDDLKSLRLVNNDDVQHLCVAQIKGCFRFIVRVNIKEQRLHVFLVQHK